MEHDGFLIALILYLAILALAVGWFLVPRWIYGSKTLMIEKARLERSVMREDAEPTAQKSRWRSHWRHARLFSGSSSH
jgi:hypothetical protein